nr:MAG TPA: hypothetical protein [Caudoviricetes sp.]
MPIAPNSCNTHKFQSELLCNVHLPYMRLTKQKQKKKQ